MLRARQTGFTLLEVLVAVVVLSIGLLGLAGLQAAGLANNHSAYLRSQATVLAYDVLDRMRTNRQAAVDGKYDIALGVMPTNYPSCYTGGSCDCESKVCDSEEMPIYDVGRWKDAVQQTLPAGMASIARNGGTFRIQILWDDARTGATGTACGGDPDVDLTCFNLTVDL